MKVQARRTQVERREATREALLRAAVEAIGEKGYVATSLQDIADRAGVSKGALHYHFKAKEDLVDEVLWYCDKRLREEAERVWQGATAGTTATPGERVRRAIEAMWRARCERRAEMAVLADLLSLGVHDERVKNAVRALFHRAEGEVAERLVEGMRALGLKPKVPVSVIPRILLAALDGLALRRFFAQERRDDEVLAALEAMAFSLFAF